MNNNLSYEEKRALDLMKKRDFRGISKDNIMQLVSILDRVDPEVAKEIIAKVPEVVHGIVENEKSYTDTITKAIESVDKSAHSYLKTEDEIVSALLHEIGKNDTSFEQKQYYIEKAEEAVKRKANMYTEHSNKLEVYIKYAGVALFVGMFCMVGMLVGKADFKLPR